MFLTNSLTVLSKLSRVQASWVNALSWWEVKLKLRFFPRRSADTGEIKKKKKQRWKTNSYTACVFNRLMEFRVRMPLTLQLSKQFHGRQFSTVPPKPAFTHQNTTPPQVSPCAAPLMNIDLFMFSLGTTQTKRQWKEKKEKYAKLCSRRSHTCTSLSLDTKLFSP